MSNVAHHVTSSKPRIQHRLGQELLVRVLRLDGDRGTIMVSEDIPLARQLRLPL
jgi:hypothetical protein